MVNQCLFAWVISCNRESPHPPTPPFGNVRQRILQTQALNLILLTASELEELRQALKLSTKSDASQEDRELFAALFACWCHNPVATFSLCLLAQAYDVSAELVKEVSEVEITVGFLMQVGTTVQ